MKDVLKKLKQIQNEGFAVEEATQEELIEFIADLKLKIDEVVSVIESRV